MCSYSHTTLTGDGFGSLERRVNAPLFKYKFVRRSGDHREIGSEGAAPAFGRAYRILRPTPNQGWRRVAVFGSEVASRNELHPTMFTNNAVK